MTNDKKDARRPEMKSVWIHLSTYEELNKLRRSDDTFDAIILRLMRFHKRFRHVGEAKIREESLP